MKLREFVEEQERLDPEFAEARHEFQPEAALMRAMIEARQSQNLTQKELAERCGIAQTEISRIERGIRNPSIRVLQKIAEGMDMYLQISFLPATRNRAPAPHSIATRRRRRRAFGLPRAVLKKSRSTNYPIFARDLELSASRARPQPGAGNSLTKRNALTRRFPKAVLSRESRCRFRTLITRDFVQKQRLRRPRTGKSDPNRLPRNRRRAASI